MWDLAKDSFYTSVINTANKLPDIPFPEKKTDDELAKLLLQPDGRTQKSLADPLHIPASNKERPRIVHYPVALVNCGTLDGNIKVLDEFCKTLGLQKNTITNPLCYSAKDANYDLLASRNRYLFLERVANVVSQEEITLESEEDIQSDDHEETVTKESDDTYFVTKYNEIRQLIYNCSNINDVVQTLGADKELLNLKDMFGRSLLHVAAENSHVDMVDFLFCVGFNPNCTEKIGLTPLGIASVKGHVDVVNMLLSHGADCRFSVPNAYNIALDIGQNDILQIFDNHITQMQSNICNLLTQCNLLEKQNVCIDNPTTEEPTEFTFDRRKVKVPVFVDNGVEKLVRAVIRCVVAHTLCSVNVLVICTHLDI